MSPQLNSRSPRVAEAGNHGRSQSKESEEKGMWSSMLDSVASGKKLPEKNLVILGGTPDTQKEFLGTLSSDASKRPQDRHKRKPVIANAFALGYTYQDVLDADQEDTLARLSIYLLSEPSPSFAPLLKPLFTPQSIPETLLVILLDWSEPWHWVRQLRDWVRLLRAATSSLGSAEDETIEQVMKEWQQRKRGPSTYETGGSGNGNESNVTLPLSQGEWDEPLGLPLCVVCHGADKVDALEIEQGWREEEFDFVLQFLRTILMKHGASLIYTSNSTPNSLPTLVHSTLGIHSLLKKQALKHNVIDRDKVLVPPNWDSWGKIRVLREGFDVEGTSSGWSIDIQPPPSSPSDNSPETAQPDHNQLVAHTSGAVLPIYESTIPSPRNSVPSNPLSYQPRIEVQAKPTQEFLTTQLETLTRLSTEDAKAASTTPTTANAPFTFSTKPSERNMNEHIGPVQVNMGGIQVDADDMLKKLKSSREREKFIDDGKVGKEEVGEGLGGRRETEEEQKAENEKLSSFFANLIKKGASGSPRGTVRDGKGGGSGSGSGRETPSKKLEGL